jgi:hypothetical protein
VRYYNELIQAVKSENKERVLEICTMLETINKPDADFLRLNCIAYINNDYIEVLDDESRAGEHYQRSIKVSDIDPFILHIIDPCHKSLMALEEKIVKLIFLLY